MSVEFPFESFINSHLTLVAEPRSAYDNARLWALPSYGDFLFIHATFARQMTLIARES